MKEYVTVWEDGKPTTLRWAVPVVRCYDCVHAAVFEHSPGKVYCSQRCRLYMVEPGGFCAWGEAKTKEVQR